MKSDDRLSAGYTLRQYHLAYAQAFKSAIKAVDPTWDYGKAIPSGALDGITRESVESQLACQKRQYPCEKNIFGQHIGYKDIIHTPYSAGAHKPLLLRNAWTYCEGARAVLNDRRIANRYVRYGSSTIEKR